MKSYTELPALAKEKKLDGETDVAEFVLNRGSKFVAEVLHSMGHEKFPRNSTKKKTSSGYSCFMIL